MKDTLGRALDRLPFRGRLIYVFSYAIEDALRLLPPRALPEGVTLEESRGERLSAAAALSPKAGDAALFARREAAGRRCLTAWSEGRPIGYRWFSTAAVDPDLEGTIALNLEPSEGYVFDTFVRAEWRGTPVNRALARAGFEALRAEGRTHGVGVVLSGNIPSLAAVARYGTLAAAV